MRFQAHFTMELLSGMGAVGFGAVVRGLVCDVRGWCCGVGADAVVQGFGAWYRGWYCGVEGGTNSTFYPCAFPLFLFSSTLLFVPLFIQLSLIPHALDKVHILYVSTFLRFCKFTENSREDKILRF
ncbi:hypothetical protein [Bartonella raoultii]|uniref:hypothetical protein n=1 Tax=Bartonella raoultii TaxID=1457020 RepID=UPI001ABB4EE9|nr:hypothetical protein [Bartonella raoultii]